MRNLLVALLVAVGVGTFAASSSFAGCGNCAGDKKEEKHAWCAKCGETDKEKCCKDAEKCEKCSLHKGSPGCKHECKAACGSDKKA